jgi:hypothetical protein
MKRIDMTEQKWGRLTAIKHVAGYAWMFRCDCGTEVVAPGPQVRSGKKRSCGCLRREVSSERVKTHGMTGSPTFISWSGMLRRCENKNSDRYRYYGAKGVCVCDRWRGKDGFSNFLADMGERPAGTTLDRIDPSGNYEPSNCRWATARVQQTNRRNRREFLFFGVPMTASEAADRYGVALGTVVSRIYKLGMTPDQAIATPVNTKITGRPRRSLVNGDLPNRRVA